ncbi:putative reverse transcriptase domain-containing protein [Tanacetum coccineum]
MGGSSSQRHTEQPLSPIPSFRNEELYSPQFLEDMYQNTVHEDSPEVPRCTPWTNEEEIALCKGWVHVSENSAKGNARKTDGFWTEVKDYVHKKTNSDKRTYDMVCGKWKTVRPNVARFCGVHDNVARMAQESGAGDEDYFNKALLDYEAEFGLPFTLRHCWEVLKYSPKWLKQVVPKYSKSSKKSKTSGSSSFNTESGDASINLNVDAGDDDENEVHEILRTMGLRENNGCRISDSQYKHAKD